MWILGVGHVCLSGTELPEPARASGNGFFRFQKVINNAIYRLPRETRIRGREQGSGLAQLQAHKVRQTPALPACFLASFSCAGKPALEV